MSTENSNDHGEAAAATQNKPILFSGGDDAMDEEDEEIDHLPTTSALSGAVPTTATTGGVGSGTLGLAFAYDDVRLIDRIITPSPYPQHNHTAGATSLRFRNALNRVTTSPTTDTEAWQALLTEANTCYRSSIPSVHAVDADTHAKLDWAESCYGALLKHFPYAASYYATIVEMLLAQSARVGEENGPLVDYGRETSRRALRCEAKVNGIFQSVLGIPADSREPQQQETTKNGNDISSSSSPPLLLGGMCVWSVELWLLYIKKAVRDAHRTSLSTIADPADRVTFVRDATTRAFEMAISNAGFCHNNHLLWKQYLAFVASWLPDGTAANDASDHALAQQQMIQRRSIYQRLVCLPMTGLDQLWQEYEAFERAQSEALSQALLSEFAPKYQHARTVYLERNRVYGSASVDLELGRLATEPVQQDEHESDQNEYASKMQDEYNLLKLWKIRCSYERSNPERLSGKELALRVRTAYKEMVCGFARHAECWHMWSMWELQHAGGSSGVSSSTVETSTSNTTTSSDNKVQHARSVLQLAQWHIPDCTLLAYAEAQIVELHGDDPAGCVAVMEQFLSRSPNTLAFVLCQQMVRRYKGIEEARAVFARARRVLLDKDTTNHNSETITAKKDESTATGLPETDSVDGMKGEAEKVGAQDPEDGNKRWMVTNRLDASIKGVNATTSSTAAAATEETAEGAETNKSTPTGRITWHLYASHAVMEHRLNRFPEIAARVYELGLRRHASFLTKPPYVLRYAQLLLELGDTMNLRALLTRAVAACEEQSSSSSLDNNINNDNKQSALAAFWDMTLRFESVLSADKTSASRLQEIEKRRQQAVVGANVEDVATGGLLSSSDVPLIGAQKSTISEQLVRTEGYDVSSSIVSGMSRTVDFLEVMGLWGSDSSSAGVIMSRQKAQLDAIAEISGGKSDSVYQKRLQYQNLAAAGLSAESAFGEGGVSGGAGGTKLLSARERLQQGAAGGPAGQAQPTAIMLAIQQSPEWVRPLLLLLPASRLRLPIVAKPPPHLTELALSTLRQNRLPAERPADEKTNGSKQRRQVGAAGGDSSDEDDGSNKVGGYGSQFRSRKRARLMQENGAPE